MHGDRTLVTGEAGSIGPYTCKALAHAGYEPVVYGDHQSIVDRAVACRPSRRFGFTSALRNAA